MTKAPRICTLGHQYYKSSDCTPCPTCEKNNKPTTGSLSHFPSPVRNALQHEGIVTIEQLAKYIEQEILALHGIGKSSLPIFQQSLDEHGFQFKA